MKLPDATELVARIRRHSLGYIHLRAQRRTERALRRAEAESREAAGEAQRANRAKSVFLANMSHGLRTPLNAILGHSRLLLENEAELSTSQLRALRHVEGGGREFLKLIDNILSVTRIESGEQFLEPTEFDIGDLLRQLEATFDVRCEHKGLSWRAEIALRETQGSRGWPQATAGSGASARQCREVHRSRERYSCGSPVATTSTALRSVTPGPGFQRRAGQPFSSSSTRVKMVWEKGGSGLGLTIARSHVELMGGTSPFEDGEKGGVVASFAVPLSKTQTGRQSSRSQTRARPRGLAPGSALRARLVGRSDKPGDHDGDSRKDRRGGCAYRGTGCEGDDRKLRTTGMLSSSTSTPTTWMRPGFWVEAIHRGRSWLDCRGSSLLSRRYLDAGFDRCIEVPLRPGRVYAELAELLGIEYEYDAVEIRVPPASTAEFNLKLPADLRDKLSKAAATHSITELKRYIGELESLGPEEQRLADHLSTLGRGFDMAAIGAVLREIHTQ